MGTVQLLRYSSMYVKDGMSNHDEYLVVSGIFWRGNISASSYVQLDFVYVVRDQPHTWYTLLVYFDLKISLIS